MYCIAPPSFFGFREGVRLNIETGCSGAPVNRLTDGKPIARI